MALVAVVAVVAVLIFGPACVWGQQLLGNTEDPRSCRALLQNRARWLPGGSYLDCSLPGVSYIDCRSLGSYFDCSLAKSAQGTSEAKVLGCTRASEPMHLGPANLTPASAQDNVLMQLSSELHQHLPEAASEATTLFLLELACRHPIQVSLLCLKGQFVILQVMSHYMFKACRQAGDSHATTIEDAIVGIWQIQRLSHAERYHIFSQRLQMEQGFD